jgi:hypothetical protein
VGRGRPGWHSKFSSFALVSDHYDTLRDAATDRVRIRDYLTFVGLPLLLAAFAWIRGAHAGHVPEVLAAVAILTGLIFNVFVLLFDLTMRVEDKTDPAHKATLTKLADQLRANISYAVLLGLLLTSLFGALALFTDTNQPLSAPITAVIVFVAVQMLLTISMILKRIRALYRAFRVAGPERIP